MKSCEGLEGHTGSFVRRFDVSLLMLACPVNDGNWWSCVDSGNKILRGKHKGRRNLLISHSYWETLSTSEIGQCVLSLATKC